MLLSAGFLIAVDNALEAVVRPHHRPNATLRVLGVTMRSTRNLQPSEKSPDTMDYCIIIIPQSSF